MIQRVSLATRVRSLPRPDVQKDPKRVSRARRCTPASWVSRNHRGYTLIEMLTTVAVLVIVLGLMVSLARQVRQRSTEQVTVSLLRNLDVLIEQYKLRNHGALPNVTPFVTDADAEPDEATLKKRALANNRDLVRVLKGQVDLSAGVFSKLPVTIYDEATLRDAWGMPIAFLPRYHRAIGMPPGGEYFFVSAGPDGKFLTRADNLYSYEATASGTK